MHSVLLVSCATPVYKLYSGKPLPQKEIAILVRSPDSDSNIYVDFVDGIKPSDDKSFYGSKWTAYFRIELKPGIHSLSVRYSAYSHSSRVNKIITFDAKAGGIYEVKASIDTEKYDWTPRVELVLDNAPAE